MLLLLVLLTGTAACERPASDETSVATAVTTTPTSAAATIPSTSTRRARSGFWLGTRTEPNVVAAEDWFEITPRAPVNPPCGVTVAFYTPVPYAGGELIGVLLGDEWRSDDPGVTTTLQPCVPTPTDDTVRAHVPAELAAELHEVCVSTPVESDGCGLLRVVRPGAIGGAAGTATAEPPVVAPGELFTVAPADPSALVCNRHELYVGTGGGLDLVGFPSESGHVALPVPGATTTTALCGPGQGVQTEPVTFVAPAIPDGPYLLCLAYRSVADSCARLVVDSDS